MSTSKLRLCAVCGVVLPAGKQRSAKYCSPACRAKHYRMVKRTRARVQAIKVGRMASCPECGTKWVAGVDHLPSAVFCSPRCRMRAYTKRVRQGAEPG